MMKEQKKYKRQGEAALYQFSHDFDSGIIKKYQANSCLYYYQQCQGKPKNVFDYDEGYFVVIANLHTNSLNFFFMKTKSKNLQFSHANFIAQTGFPCTKLKQTDNKKFLIQYLDKGEIFSWQIKLLNDQVCKQWRRLMCFYKPDIMSSSRPSKPNKCRKSLQQIKIEEDKLLSTKDTKDSRCEQTEVSCQSSLQKYESLQLEGFRKQNKLYKDKIGELKQLLSEKQLLLKTERQTRQVYLKENQEYKRSSGSFERQRERELLQTIQNLQAKIKKLTIQKNNDAQKSQIKQLQAENLQLKIQNQSLRKQNHELFAKIAQLSQQLKERELEQQKINSQLKKSRQALQQSNIKICKYEKDLQDMKKTNEELTVNINTLNKRIRQSQQKQSHHDHLSKKLQKSQKICQDQRKQLQKLNSEQKEIERLLKQKYEMRQVQVTTKYQSVLKENEQMKKSYEENKNALKRLMLNNIFNANILQEYFTYKQLLVSEIESFTNQTISKSKLLYKYDPLNKINFHNYIDGFENIVLIVRLSNGYHLAAFSESPFLPKSSATDAGFILSLTSRKTFKCYQNKKTVTYDDYYIIFGNSELRIKSLENRIFSNFGIANGFYNCGIYKVDVLFGQEQREVGLIGYEIYQVQFQ